MCEERKEKNRGAVLDCDEINSMPETNINSSNMQQPRVNSGHPSELA
jgi:hypothetical protein